MQVTMYELGKKQDACIQRRNFEVDLFKGESSNLQRVGAIQNTIDKVLFDGMDKPHANAELHRAFEEIPFTSEASRPILEARAWRDIDRYLTCEKRRSGAAGDLALIKAPKIDVPLNSDLTVSVKPKFINIRSGNRTTGTAAEEGKVYYDKLVNVVLIKAGKPDMTQSEANTSPVLYAMLKYGEQLALPGEETMVLAEIYYLRKKNDTAANAARPNYDLDFFNTVGGNNIVSMSEIVTGPNDKTEKDIEMEQVLQDFVDGIEMEECSKEDCSYCPIRNSCHYEKAPAMLDAHKKTTSLADLDLSDDQLKAISFRKGIARINAGAGAGKTMVVALRTAMLLQEGVKPEEICLMTFTNAGAEEMRIRIGDYCSNMGVEVDVSKILCCTFNSFGNEVIKKEFEEMGFTAPPKVIDDVERSRIIANLLNQANIPDLDYANFSTDMPTCKGALAIGKKVFEIIKKGDYGISEEDLRAVRSALGRDQQFCSGRAVEGLMNLYDQYDAKLHEDNLIEFSDQEILLKRHLERHRDYLNSFGFKHVIVDEFQDSNLGQVELIEKFTHCPTFESLMVVGDDMQSIYGFRDTSPTFMIHFQEYIHQSVEDIFLVDNYRSTDKILDFANKIAEYNKERIPKDLKAYRKGGRPVIVTGFHEKSAEQEFVINGVKQHLDSGIPAEKIAVICSTKNELMEMGSLFNDAGIPAVLLNPEPLLDNSRVVAAISLARCLVDPTDTEDLLTYTNARLGGNILEMTAEEVRNRMEESASMLEAVRELGSDKDQKETVIQMMEALDPDGDEVYASFLESVKVKATYQKLLEYALDFSEFGSKTAFRRTHDYPGVVLTTAHSAKGLEWDVVYAMISKFDAQELNTGTRLAETMTEEKNRLLFVTATRARDELIVTGQYIAYGKKGAYHHNRFLQECYDCVGQVFDLTTILNQKEMILAERKQKRAEEKEKKKKEQEEIKARLQREKAAVQEQSA